MKKVVVLRINSIALIVIGYLISMLVENEQSENFSFTDVFEFGLSAALGLVGLALFVSTIPTPKDFK